jgi:hypothetical protein
MLHLFRQIMSGEMSHHDRGPDHGPAREKKPSAKSPPPRR